MKAVKINQEEGQYSHSLQAVNGLGESVIIPVMDVRDGEATRSIVELMEKNTRKLRGSKYMRYNQYNEQPQKRW